MKRIKCFFFPRFYLGKAITFLLLMTFFYISYKTVKLLNNDSALQNLSPWLFMSLRKDQSYIDIDETVDNSKKSLKFNQIDHEDLLAACPVCLGSNICDNIDLGALDVSNYAKTKEGTTFTGTWHTSTKVLVKITNKSYLKLYKQQVCHNLTSNHNCPSANSEVSIPRDFFSVNSVRNIHKLTLQKRSDLPITLCATEKFVAHLKKVYDLNNDDETSDNELLTLYTSLAINPEALVHMFIFKSSISLPISYFYGVCGHIMVLENNATPLKEYLSESFAVRAGLAVQILQIVEDFLEEDTDWLFLFTNFTYDNIAVKEDGDVVLTDVSNVAIIDKSLSPSYANGGMHDNKLCNEACYKLHTSDLFKSHNVHEACSRISHISHMMYAVVCKNILSNLDEHKINSIPNSQKSGLLHTIPKKDQQVIEDLLLECVKETSAGGRLQAAEELKEMLGEYANDDDVTGKDDSRDMINE